MFASIDPTPIKEMYKSLTAEILPLISSTIYRHKTFGLSAPTMQSKILTDLHNEGDAFAKLLENGNSILDWVPNYNRTASEFLNNLRAFSELPLVNLSPKFTELFVSVDLKGAPVNGDYPDHLLTEKCTVLIEFATEIEKSLFTPVESNEEWRRMCELPQTSWLNTQAQRLLADECSAVRTCCVKASQAAAVYHYAATQFAAKLDQLTEAWPDLLREVGDSDVQTQEGNTL